MKKLLFLLTFLFAFSANASSIPEGAIVKTVTNPDVYIVKYNAGKQYKRLVLNPLVFKSYGHLKWENLLTISQAEMDSFATSDLVRVDGSTDIYQLVPEGDNGGKYQLTSTEGYDTNSIYTINRTDFLNYVVRGSRGAKVTQGITQNTSTDNSEKIERETRAAKALVKITSETEDLGKKMEALSPRIKYIQGQTANATYTELISLTNELNEINEEYNALKYKLDRLTTISYEVRDYGEDGTKVPAVDRAYLISLGISL